MKEKPYLVCCICKREYNYLKEFVEYHLSIGFDKIIIGDNNDIGSKEFYEVLLKDFIIKDQVMIIDIRGIEGYQKQFYNYVIKTFDYEWCAFIDCDEFITISPLSRYSNIKEFLRSNPSINAYGLNWMVYGDNGLVLYDNRKVTDRFIKPMPYDFRFHKSFSENSHIKSVISWRCGKNVDFDKNPHVTNYHTYFSPSGIKLKHLPFNKTLDYSYIYIRHFYTKSLQEWVEKKMKCKHADDVKGEDYVYYPIADYFIYNEMTDEKAEYLKKKGIKYDKKN